MAFNLWVEDTKLSNILSPSAYASDMQREEGFTPGDVASAIRVNSALRQSNLVACAMMDALGITNASLTTTRSKLTEYITAGLNKGRDAITGDYVPNVTNTYDLGKQGKQWKEIRGQHIYASNTIDTNLLFSSGGITSDGYIKCRNGTVEGVDVKDSVGTLATLRAYASELESRVDALESQLITTSLNRTNLNKVYFKTDTITYVKTGNVVTMQFFGRTTDQSRVFQIDDLSDDNVAYLRPKASYYPGGVDNSQVGMAIISVSSSMYIYYDPTTQSLFLRSNDGEQYYNSGLLVHGFAVWVTDSIYNN